MNHQWIESQLKETLSAWVFEGSTLLNALEACMDYDSPGEMKEKADQARAVIYLMRDLFNSIGLIASGKSSSFARLTNPSELVSSFSFLAETMAKKNRTSLGSKIVGERLFSGDRSFYIKPIDASALILVAGWVSQAKNVFFDIQAQKSNEGVADVLIRGKYQGISTEQEARVFFDHATEHKNSGVFIDTQFDDEKRISVSVKLSIRMEKSRQQLKRLALISDSDVISTDTLKSSLGDLGYIVTLVDTWDEFMLKKNKTDPTLNVIEVSESNAETEIVLKKIQSIDPNQKILLTVPRDENVIKMCKNNGWIYLARPFTVSDIEDAIRKVNLV